MSVMTLPANLDQLTADELRELVLSQAAVITRNDQELNWRQAKIDKLTHEVAYYKRHYFGVKAERLPVEQGQLFEETLAADMAAMTEELAQLSETKPKGQAKRKPVAGGTAAHRDSPRTGIDDSAPVAANEAHRRRCRREVRLHPGHLYGRTAHPRQVGLCPVRKRWCRRRFRRM
jgi:hypothetical protein